MAASQFAVENETDHQKGKNSSIISASFQGHLCIVPTRPMVSEYQQKRTCNVLLSPSNDVFILLLLLLVSAWRCWYIRCDCHTSTCCSATRRWLLCQVTRECTGVSNDSGFLHIVKLLSLPHCSENSLSQEDLSLEHGFDPRGDFTRCSLRWFASTDSQRQHRATGLSHLSCLGHWNGLFLQPCGHTAHCQIRLTLNQACLILLNPCYCTWVHFLNCINTRYMYTYTYMHICTLMLYLAYLILLFSYSLDKFWSTVSVSTE